MMNTFALNLACGPVAKTLLSVVGVCLTSRCAPASVVCNVCATTSKNQSREIPSNDLAMVQIAIRIIFLYLKPMDLPINKGSILLRPVKEDENSSSLAQYERMKIQPPLKNYIDLDLVAGNC